MTTDLVITNFSERVELGGANQGETSFTVTNQGSRSDRVVFEVVADDGADLSWFVPPPEPQINLAGGASASFVVKIVVPAGAPAGVYALQGRAYPADSAPEEGSRLSGRVAFEVKASVKPKPKPWWPYAVAAGLVVVVLGVIGFLVFGGEDEPGPPAGYPAEPRAYAEAVLGAWGAKQSARLADLTNAQANGQITQIPGPPNMKWNFVQCGGGAGSSYCEFYNDAGDTILLQLTNELLGKPQATSSATFSSLPTNAQAYAQEFVKAWQRGDQARMLQLSVPKVAGELGARAVPKNPRYFVMSSDGTGVVLQINESGGSAYDVQFAKTSLGKQHAIVGYSIPPIIG